LGWVDKSDEKMFWSTINMTAVVKILVANESHGSIRFTSLEEEGVLELTKSHFLGVRIDQNHHAFLP
jgi:hypothetical protein